MARVSLAGTGAWGDAATRLLGVAVLAATALGVAFYPYARLELGLGLLAYVGLGLWRPRLLLFLLPVWLALVNLAPWSGSMYREDYDLVLGATLGVLLARGMYALRIRLTRAQWLFLALLVASYLISIGRGLWPLPPLDPVELSTYYSRWHAVRLGKGFFWALFLFPGVVALLRGNHAYARANLAWGLATAGGAMGLVAMWERGVFNALLESGSLRAVLDSLLDFGMDYRITGLFSEMHTGGEAIDSFLALTWPFGLLAAAGASSRGRAVLGGALFAGALYAVVTTYSRASYLALLAGAVMAAGILLLRHRAVLQRPAQQRPIRLEPAALAGLLAPVALALVYPKGGLVALAAGLAGWVACLALGHGMARARGMLGWGLALAVALVSAWGMAQGMIASRWVLNDPDLAWGLALGLALPVGTSGYWLGGRLTPRFGMKGLALAVALVSAGVGIVTPALLGARMESRLAGSESDMATRWDHWRDTLNLMPPDWDATLFGMGVGRFPAEYLWAGPQHDIGTYRFERGADGNIRLLLGAGQDARMTQRVALPARQNYTLSLDASTNDPELWLRARLYRRNIILASDWPGEHLSLDKTLDDTHGRPVRLTWRFNIGDLGERGLTGRQPLVLELMNFRKYGYVTRAGTVVAIDNVSLKDDQGREWLDNGDFSRGLERWFPYYDFNHLPWHIKNLWVHIYFDQGVLGLVSLMGFLGATLLAAVGRARQGDAWALAVSAAMASFLTVGLFGGLLDMPRVIFIAYLMLFITALSGPARVRRARADSARAGEPAARAAPAPATGRPGAGPAR